MKNIYQKHGIDAGDLVRVRIDDRYPDSGLIGLVQWVSQQSPPICGVMIEGKVALYDYRQLEVVSESR